MLLSKVPERSKNILVEERGSRIQVKHHRVHLDHLLGFRIGETGKQSLLSLSLRREDGVKLDLLSTLESTLSLPCLPGHMVCREAASDWVFLAGGGSYAENDRV